MKATVSHAKQRPLRAVLFDWDGTLLDSYTAGEEAFRKMFLELGVEFTHEEFSTAYSPDWYETYRALGLAEKRWAEADRLWRKFYADHAPGLVAGAQRVLIELRAQTLKLGLITTGHRSRVREELLRLNLVEMFDVVICGDDCEHVKPNPEGIERALAALALSPDQALYVGDAPEDLAMARSAGLRFLGIPSPYPTNRLLREHGAKVLGSLAELVAVLAG